MHSLYGNRCGTFGIKLYHINKGNSHFKNKINDIQMEIQTHNPDIISLSEANLELNDKWSTSQFPDYRFLYDSLSSNIGWARQVALIKTHLPVTRRTDLETPNSSIIWFEIESSEI